MSLRARFCAFLAAVLILCAAPCADARIELPERPFHHVVDLAGIVDENVEAALNRFLLELEQKTTAQMVVLTIPGLEGESIESFSLSVAHDRWRLGQKDRDNGLLLLVALADRQYRIETGYGLEGVIPDSLAGEIGRQYLVPNFRKGDYSSGIAAASLALIQQIASSEGVEISGMPRLAAPAGRTGGGRGQPTLAGTIVSILFFAGLIYLFIRHPRLLLFFLMMNMMGGGRRSSWGGGGGFGGGSFGGGGGGGFGGGGASGGW